MIVANNHTYSQICMAINDKRKKRRKVVMQKLELASEKIEREFAAMKLQISLSFTVSLMHM